MYEQIQATKPLILNITNHVTMNFVANGLLSLGASPMMTLAIEELEDLITLAHSVVINIGTLTPEFNKLSVEACRIANQFNKPLILDPVGAGASHYRTQFCQSLLNNFQFAMIRGNASEIMALSGQKSSTKGVDSSKSTHQALESANYLANQYKTLVVVSGKTDAVVDSYNQELFEGGSDLMPRVTGSGCLLSAVLAAFHSVEPNAFLAAARAVVFYGQCGEIAEKNAQAPGSFAMHFLDALSLYRNSR